MPKSRAPTGRNACVRNTAPRTAEGLVWNSPAIALTQKTRRKKSRLSSVQPRNAARNTWRCERVSWRNGARTDTGGSIADGQPETDRIPRTQLKRALVPERMLGMRGSGSCFQLMFVATTILLKASEGVGACVWGAYIGLPRCRIELP